MCAYCDADWDNNMDDCKSTSSYVFSLGNDVINYNNKKETFVVMSPTKIEYMTTSQTTKQVMWLLSLFGTLVFHI